MLDVFEPAKYVGGGIRRLETLKGFQSYRAGWSSGVEAVEKVV